MPFREGDKPRAHLVVDDFFETPALDVIFKEIASLDRHLKPGLVRDIGHDGQSVFFEHARRRNKAVWIHDPSRTLRLFREQLWSAPMLDAFDHAREPLFQIIGNCSSPNLQISKYMTGDHYAFHEDEGAGVNLTALVFLARDSRKIHGGDLVLHYNGDETTIRFRHNRLVIFPSKTLHRVTRVRVDSVDIKDARISLQSWLAYGHLAKTTKTKTKTKPEADRPTFLLAEESIIAAAQAMIASSSSTGGREQTPEDIYWGAFYLSRILSANLRCLVDAQGAAITLGATKIRHGEDGLEVYARVHHANASPMRIGFLLRGRDVAMPFEALSLFVERGRGASTSMSTRVLPLGAEEHDATTLLRELLRDRRIRKTSPKSP